MKTKRFFPNILYYIVAHTFFGIGFGSNSIFYESFHAHVFVANLTKQDWVIIMVVGMVPANRFSRFCQSNFDPLQI